jgi:hypothetical protein
MVFVQESHEPFKREKRVKEAREYYPKGEE